VKKNRAKNIRPASRLEHNPSGRNATEGNQEELVRRKKTRRRKKKREKEEIRNNNKRRAL
jgi:hypothetical protein